MLARERCALTDAVEAWCEAVGADRVLEPEPFLANTSAVEREVTVVLRPANHDDVVAIVRIASHYGIPLYPVSRGNNWGYGSAVPHENGCAIVVLADLDTIDDSDLDLGVITVGPGVTQGMLFAFLEERGVAYMVPTHGGGPDCSLVGNALERGYGITPHMDHFGAATSLEAVLADGTVYRGALSELGAPGLDRLFKWGLGPYTDGLFSQGSLGIVTQMSFALAKRPESVVSFFFGFEDPDDFEEIVSAIRRLEEDLPGVVGAVNLMNQRRVLSMMERVHPDQATSVEQITRLAAKRKVLSWTGMGALYGDRRVVRAAKKRVRECLRGRAQRLVFLTESTVRRAQRWVPSVLLGPYSEVLDSIARAFEILRGKPNRVALPLAYAKRWGPSVTPDQNLNPARDGCGLIWYAPLVPMRGAVVQAYVARVTRVCLEHDIEPLITLTTQSPRCFDSTVPILFDRSDPVAGARAQACFRALFEAGRQLGCVPYRLGVGSMDLVVGPTVFWKVGAALRRAVDPGGIIAPGRYGL